MPGIKRLQRFGLLSVVALFVLATACGGAEAVSGHLPFPCSWVIDLEPDVEPGGEIVVPMGGSQRIRVHVRNQWGRDREFHSNCSYLRNTRPNWTIDDPSVARVEEYRATAALYSSWAITGLAVGETRVHLWYGVREPGVSIRLRVVES